MAVDETRPRLSDYTRPSGMKRTPSADAPPATPLTGSEPTNPGTLAAKVKTPTDEELLAQTDAKETAEDRELKTRLSIYEDMSQALTPVKDYEEFLKRHEISEEQAEKIVDNVIMRGYHEEEYPITKRSGVRLRTRSHEDTLRLHAALQIQQPTMQTQYDELVARYTLAASLAEITGPKGRHFEFPTEETTKEDDDKLFDLRMRFIERMPSPLFGKLSIKLAEFDRLVMAVMREGVTENF